MRRERPGQYRAALRIARRFARPHTASLALGGVAALGLAACRLAIPWPLRWSLHALKGHDAGLPAWIDDPVVAAALAYLLIAVAYGVCELVERTQLGRFSSALTGDLRAAALRGAASIGVSGPGELGDLTSRLIGDAARLRSNLNGILVHASMNGLVFVAVSALMLVVSPPLGLVFLVSGAAAIGIGAATSPVLHSIARRQRVKEGQFAGVLQSELTKGGSAERLASLSDSGARKEVRATLVLARSTLAAHAVLAAGVAAGLWLGSRAIRAGTLAPGELFLFIAYALMVQRRLVQVGRQMARTGKVVASLNRLAALVGADAPDRARSATPLPSALRIVGAHTRGARGGRRAKLRRMDLQLAPGSRVAVLGPVGSGKSSLLRVLAGRDEACEGEIHWGDEPLGADPRRLAERVGYIPERVAFSRRPLWESAGLASAEPPTGAAQEVLEGVGAAKIATAFDDAWSSRVASIELSAREARNLSLARLVLADDSPVWILDGVLDERSRKKARRCLDEILRRAGQRAVIVSMSRALDLERFDRVIELRCSRVVFDGPPSERKRTRRGAA